MHITIGLPLYNVMPIESFLSFINLIHETLNLVGIEKLSYSFINIKGLPVDQARNQIAKKFLEEKESDYLLFLDSDMTFPQNLIKRLLAIDGDISSALAFKKWVPHLPTIYVQRNDEKFHSLVDYEPNKIIEVDACGMACCLIKRKVFEVIEQPFFKFEEIINRDTKTIEILGEDLSFCKKVRKTGFKIKVDTGLIAGHIGGIIDDKTFQGGKQFYNLEDK